jgi:hypothetical protein
MAQRLLSTVFCPSTSIAITPATAKPNNWREITDLAATERHVTESLRVACRDLTSPFTASYTLRTAQFPACLLCNLSGGLSVSSLLILKGSAVKSERK